MNEKLFQFIWKFQYFNKQNLQTADGKTITILHPGELNTNEGPDFCNGKIKIEQVTWAGNIELHINASDWIKHKHQDNQAYQKIILHVVLNNDCNIQDSNNHTLPTLLLKDRISGTMLNSYHNWMMSNESIPCAAQINHVKEITWNAWKMRLLIERLEHKNELIQKHLKQTNYHWEEVFWRMLCRYFGGNINGVSFEQIAESLPISILAKHKTQINQLEALLLGQSGLLHKNFKEAYPQMLYKEYSFLQKKYGLQVINKPPSFLRMRPINFPTIRLAQLAMLIQTSVHLFSKVKEAKDAKSIEKLFKVTANDYWHYHFSFDEETAHQPKAIGKQMIDTLIINAVVPVIFAYALNTQNNQLKEHALLILEQITAEKNTLTKPFTTLNIACKNAFDSQAFIQLNKEYCQPKKCLSCAIGNAILKKID